MSPSSPPFFLHYQVIVTPLHTDDDELEHFAQTIYDYGTTDPQTPCGCSGSVGTPNGL